MTSTHNIGQFSWGEDANGDLVWYDQNDNEVARYDVTSDAFQLGKNLNIEAGNAQIRDDAGDLVIEDLASGNTFEYDSSAAAWTSSAPLGTGANPLESEFLSADQARIRDPSIVPNDQAQGGAHIQTPPSPGEKTQLLAPGDTSWTTDDIAWGSIFPAHKFFDNPLGDYYLYYSEDHTADAKIGVAYADEPLGPFTDYASNPIITAYDNQETPSPVWNPVDSRMVMFVHTTDAGVGTDQTTVALTSTDGLVFTDQGVAVDAPPNTAGNGHTGYFMPARWGGSFWGYHLLGSSDYPRFGVSVPEDDTLLSWETDPRPIGNHVDTTGDRNRRIEWNMSNIVAYGGSPWWIGVTSNFTSGTNYSGKRLATAPLANKRRLGRRPTELATAGSEAWEGGGIAYPRTFTDHPNRRLYSTYTSGGSIGAIDLGRCF